ncbi:S-methyl-5'-thioadenosine phosphorylase [Coprinopsis marcescibilis]|uniref:S-methyl-5'-thioadenosine phosphorylase n=1 Tax=Coprinopsis marcescibilis TaxID=230819 RepID=A0A5C3KRB2_COPMA|nr:S-methyl-5'-thioadenosine phosphorylase [Coprinopsis marcescibilis]
MSEEGVLIGVIGGSGLYQLDNLTIIKTVNPETPWGYPSSPITIAALPSGTKVAFIARHGIGHVIPPSRVPGTANIAALKSIGVTAIVSFSAVGSLREEVSPGSFVLPSQVIDRTKGIRDPSFFTETSVVAHAMFGDPFSNKLIAWLEPRVRKVLEEEGKGRKLFTDKTIICMEGPQFSTRAESIMYRQWGADLINMSVLPESKLAREAEISYALIAMATDYDSWRPQSDAVTAHDVVQTLHDNGSAAKLVLSSILDDLHLTLHKHHLHIQAKGEGEAVAVAEALLQEKGTMKFSIMPTSPQQNPEDFKKLAFILPEYFSKTQ